MVLAICAATIWINLTSFDWNDHDKKIYNKIKRRCETLYKDAPCLSRFVKSGKQMYRVYCGENLKKD